MKYRNKIINIFLIVVFVFSFVVINPQMKETVQADEVEKLKQQINELVSEQNNIALEKEQSHTSLQELENRKSTTNNNLSWLNERSVEQQEAYESLLLKQDAILTMQNSTLENLRVAEDSFNTKKEQYGERIETMFGMQQKSVFELLLESESLEGFFTSVKFMKIITEDDEAALEDLKKEQTKLVELTEETQKSIDINKDELADIENLLTEIEENIDFQVDKINILDDSIGEISEEIDSFQIKESEIEAALVQAQANIEQIEAEREAARIAAEEEAARIAAEEEAARIAAVEAEAKYQAQAESSNLNDSINGTSEETSQVAPPPAPPTYTGGALAWPVPGYYGISSYYGNRSFLIGSSYYSDFHTGVDFPAPAGTPVVASAGGTIVYSAWMNVGGNTVMIDHGNNLITMYCHLSNFNCSVGQAVTAGQTIAYIGSTGFSTGAHLHFEVRSNGRSVDPLGYLG